MSRFRSYSNDPRWMTARYPGTDAKGSPFKAGDRVFYYPSSKTVYAGENAEAAARDFEAQSFDEWMMS